MACSIPQASSRPLLRVASEQDGALAVSTGSAGHQHLLGKALGAARIVVGARARPVGDQLGGDGDAHGGVEGGDLVVDGGEVAVLQRGEPARADEQAVPARGLPLDLAAEHADLHVEHALEAQQLAVVRSKGSSSTKRRMSVPSVALTIVWPVRASP